MQSVLKVIGQGFRKTLYRGDLLRHYQLRAMLSLPISEGNTSNESLTN